MWKRMGSSENRDTKTLNISGDWAVRGKICPLLSLFKESVAEIRDGWWQVSTQSSLSVSPSQSQRACSQSAVCGAATFGFLLPLVSSGQTKAGKHKRWTRGTAQPSWRGLSHLWCLVFIRLCQTPQHKV